MSNYLTEFALTNIEFGINDNHRYVNIDGKFNIKAIFSNARFIKNNVIDVNSDFESVNKFNYGFYRTSVDGKRYYFFILSCDYINDVTTRITFKIDWFSTDFRNITFTTSFVERQHPILDTLADYPRTLENIGNQYPLETNYTDVFNLDYTNAKYIIATTSDIPVNELFITEDKSILNYSAFDLVYGIFSHSSQKLHSGELNFTYFVCDNLYQVNNYIRNALSNGYQDSIGGIWRVPSFFANSDYTEDYTIYVKYGNVDYSETIKILSSSERILQLSANGFIFKYPTSVDNYTPFYKKCLDYQYINPCVLANDSQVVFNYSFFKTQENQNNVINLFFDCKGDSNIYIVPYQYNGSNEHDFTHCTTVKISVPVQISCSNSVYLKETGYQAELNIFKSLTGVASSDVTKQVVSSTQTLSTATSGTASTSAAAIDSAVAESTALSSVASAGVVALAFGAINVAKASIENQLNKVNAAVGTTMVGGTGNTTISKLSEYGQNIHFGFVSYCNEDIQRVDKYFSMYGYNYSTLMLPQLRNSYTYLQGDINFTGDINAESYNEIKKLFRYGVTIWDETNIYEYDVQ